MAASECSSSCVLPHTLAVGTATSAFAFLLPVTPVAVLLPPPPPVAAAAALLRRCSSVCTGCPPCRHPPAASSAAMSVSSRATCRQCGLTLIASACAHSKASETMWSCERWRHHDYLAHSAVVPPDASRKSTACFCTGAAYRTSALQAGKPAGGAAT